MRHAKKAATNPLQTDHRAGHKAACGAAGWRANLAHATHVAACSLSLVVVVAVVLDESVGLLPDRWAAGAVRTAYAAEVARRSDAGGTLDHF